MKKQATRATIIAILPNIILVVSIVALITTGFSKGINHEERLEFLFLTPFLKNGSIEKAQNLSMVSHPKFLDIKSYSGYLTVNETTDSHMFFWYFPPEIVSLDNRFILWLNGGPGTSSLYGLFMELGPYVPISPTEVSKRNYSWHKENHLLFLDNPVGTGYSITKDGYTTNHIDVGKDLLIVIKQFLQLFPNLQEKEFYLTGESYAGKYIPSLAYAIHYNNQNSANSINLKGLFIINGLTDPINQLNYADYFYQLGLIDRHQAANFKDARHKCITHYKAGNNFEAFQIFSDMIIGNFELTRYGTMFENFTGFTNLYNLLKADEFDEVHNNMINFLQLREIKQALHVGNVRFDSFAKNVSSSMKYDYLISAAPLLSELLSHYRVMLPVGQIDLVVPYPLIVDFINQLNYTGSHQYKLAPRLKWYVDSELAGYYKIAGNLTEVLIRNAGHMIPKDQPKWANRLLLNFLNTK